MERISVSPKLYFYVEEKTTLNKIKDLVPDRVVQVFNEVAQAGLEKAGPLEFIYFGASPDVDKEITLQIALPVKEKKSTKGDFQFRKTADFSCLSYNHKGSVAEMSDVYDQLFEHVWNNSIKTTNEIREVHHSFEHPESANNITEIQIGLNQQLLF